MRHLPLILKNCWRNRRRTILTVLSMGVSICLLGVLLAIYHALFAVQPTRMGRTASGHTKPRFADVALAPGLPRKNRAGAGR